ncbi:HAMP domain-containing protein [Phototrophicus methaneseepsis]|uniref:histidine kinase n=1 Tax=Phototrophicus methaneseepsis TaxID=2710758 RepID=A0A7S8EAA7_9CHLR|nr:histidine kinase [Phototrophicus methaneseepsis]QPC83153.1 HAMP domain-containing protein [Phototrophicus methaneseepsis]
MEVRLKIRRFFTGLWGQVFLWTLLPIMSLLMIFSFVFTNNHQEAMHNLAIEDNTELVRTLAQMLSMQIKYSPSNLSDSTDVFSLDDVPLEQLLEDIHPDISTALVVVDSDGRVLFSDGSLDPGEDILKLSYLPQSHGSNIFVSTTVQGDIIASAPIMDTDWTLILRENGRLFNTQFLQFEEIIPIILMATLGISFMTLYFGLNYIARPVNILKQYTHQIADGEFDAASRSAGGIREIEELRSAINQMAAQLQQDQIALQTYLGAVTGAQEEERARLARELHDDTVQDLIALDHRVQRIQRTIKQNPDDASQHANVLRQMIDKAIRDVRRMCLALRPLYLDELGLVASLETLAHETKATFRLIGSPIRLSSEYETTLYRIVQEALNNAVNHAQAKQIDVEIRFDFESIQMIVRDNGVGFKVQDDFEVLAKHRHFGLLGMHERAQLLKGNLQIHSSPGVGTSILIIMPINAQ